MYNLEKFEYDLKKKKLIIERHQSIVLRDEKNLY